MEIHLISLVVAVIYMSLSDFMTLSYNITIT